MIQIPGRIPISIYPTFWLFAALIGYINSMTFVGTLIWVGIIFVSVLFHEFGHALTAMFFGKNPRIELVALGGLTYHDGDKLPFWKQFFITLDGPLFGLILAGLGTVLLQFPFFSTGMARPVLELFRGVNLFWTLVNLLPVMPLDGGQLLRIVLESIFGFRGFKFALMASMIIATGISLFFFLYQAFIIGALFFLLAFQSYDTWRRTRTLSDTDRKESIKKELEKAEEYLQAGRKEDAAAEFEAIRKEAKKGMIYTLATQYLAFLKYEMGKVKESYDLLLSIRPELGSDALCLLHRVAFEQKNYSLVIELAGTCYQTLPSADIALRNAYAHASLSQVDPAVGWLQTAVQEGIQNLDQILGERSFDNVRNDPQFKQFVSSLKDGSS